VVDESAPGVGPTAGSLGLADAHASRSKYGATPTAVRDFVRVI
jgi:hypothetical protein